MKLCIIMRSFAKIKPSRKVPNLQNHLLQGFANVAKGLLKLGLLSDEPVANLQPEGREKTWVRKKLSAFVIC